MKPRSHRAYRATHYTRRFNIAHLMQFAEYYNFSIVRRQREDRIAERLNRLTASQLVKRIALRDLRRWSDSLFARIHKRNKRAVLFKPSQNVVSRNSVQVPVSEPRFGSKRSAVRINTINTSCVTSSAISGDPLI